MKPLMRQERMVVRDVDDETLVYDLTNDTATCLNGLAAQVFRRCNGETEVAEIAEALDVDEKAVWLALHELDQKNFLSGKNEMPDYLATRRSRREVAATLGFGAAAAMVSSVLVPTPAQAQSCVAQGDPCNLNNPGACCSQACLSNSGGNDGTCL